MQRTQRGISGSAPSAPSAPADRPACVFSPWQIKFGESVSEQEIIIQAQVVATLLTAVAVDRQFEFDASDVVTVDADASQNASVEQNLSLSEVLGGVGVYLTTPLNQRGRNIFAIQGGMGSSTPFNLPSLSTAELVAVDGTASERERTPYLFRVVEDVAHQGCTQ